MDKLIDLKIHFFVEYIIMIPIQKCHTGQPKLGIEAHSFY